VELTVASWGQTPFFGEYSSDGTLLWSAQLGVGDVQAYRVLRSNWTAYPTWSPAIAVDSNTTTSSHDIYVSWNGATEVSTWEVLGSTSQNGTYISLANGTKSGFETLVSVQDSTVGSYAYLQVRGVAGNGTVLEPAALAEVNGTVLSSTTTAQASVAATSSVMTGTASASASSSGGERLTGGGKGGWMGCVAAGVVAGMTLLV
jgi:hypothetical protein